MTEFEFNCMTTANYLMGYAKRQHYLAVDEAHVRQIQREAAREYRKVRRERRMNVALWIASIVGLAVATWFQASVGVT